MTIPTLAARHADLTRQVILDAAIALMETEAVHDISARSVAKQAGLSERTLFRYFADREELLDAIAGAVTRRLELPPEPRSLQELLDYPAALYTRYEATTALTKAALHSELYHRVRTHDAEQRGQSLRKLVDELAPKAGKQERKLAWANIRYALIASTWHYFRFYFGFSLDDSVQSARLAIVQQLKGLGLRVK